MYFHTLVSVVLEICLVGALFGLGYMSLGGEAATAAALEDGLLELEEDDNQVSSGGLKPDHSIVGRRGVQMHNIDRNIDHSESGSGAYNP